MKTWKFAAVAAVFVLSGMTAMAQTPKKAVNEQIERITPEQIAKKRTERMTKELSLTKEQAKQVYDLTLEQSKQKMVGREAAKAKMEQRREAVKTVRDANAEKMKSILTPEQYAKWQEKQKKTMMHRHHDKGEFMKMEGRRNAEGMSKKACCVDAKNEKQVQKK